jgi:hypothetical protein
MMRIEPLRAAHALEILPEPTALQDAGDVFVDLDWKSTRNSPSSRLIGLGVPAIVWADDASQPTFASDECPAVRVARGHTDRLSQAMLEVALDRPNLAARCLAGLAWGKARTVEASHRRRAELIHYG